MILGDIIKEYREKNNLSQRDFAKKCGLSYTYISALEKNLDYRSGKPISPTLETIRNVANNVNSNVINVYGTIPAGIPMEMIEDVIDTEEIDAGMLKGEKQYFGLKIKGNSMYPEYLDGDTIILEKVNDCESGQDCVVMVNGNDGTFKKVIKNEAEQTIKLQPINTTLDENGNFLYEPITYTKEQIEKLPVKIIGKVVELRRKK